jgi:hypothetical protein
MGVLLEQSLGFGPQGKVGDEHGAALLEEEAGKLEIDARASAGHEGRLAGYGDGHGCYSSAIAEEAEACEVLLLLLLLLGLLRLYADE